MLSLQIVNHIGDANIGLPLDFMLVKIIKKTQKIRKQLQKKNIWPQVSKLFILWFILSHIRILKHMPDRES